MEYLFETPQLGISHVGFHLLRNRFNYQTIEYGNIIRAEIRIGKEINNWVLTLLLGLLLLLFATYYSISLATMLYKNIIHVIYIEEIVIPVFPALIGGYCVYAALRKGPILTFKTEMRKYKYPLRHLENGKTIGELQDFLKTKFSTHLTISTEP